MGAQSSYCGFSGQLPWVRREWDSDPHMQGRETSISFIFFGSGAFGSENNVFVTDFEDRVTRFLFLFRTHVLCRIVECVVLPHLQGFFFFLLVALLAFFLSGVTLLVDQVQIKVVIVVVVMVVVVKVTVGETKRVILHLCGVCGVRKLTLPRLFASFCCW